MDMLRLTVKPTLYAALAGAIVLQAWPAAAIAREQASAAMRFRALRAEGMTAGNAGDLVTASAKLAEADALVANHPGLITLRARVAMASGRTDEAIAFWRRYAGLGLAANPARDPLYAPMVAAPEFAAVAERLAANRAPVGAVTVAATLTDPLVIENVVADTARGRLLVSSIAGRTILQVDAAGVATPWLVADASVAGVLGLAMDPERGLLWAASSGMAVATPEGDALRNQSELLKIDLASGRLLARYRASEAPLRNFGDVTVGLDGTVYLSDSRAGDVWRLKPGTEALEQLVPAGMFGSPQGMAVTPDGTALIIADYGSGLYRIALDGGAVTAIAAPETASLIGVDALVRHDDHLVAVQNGVTPLRVLRLNLSPGFDRVTGTEVLAAGLPEMADPAGGTISGDELVFVATSQLGSYNDAGALTGGPPPPAVIARLALR